MQQWTIFVSNCILFLIKKSWICEKQKNRVVFWGETAVLLGESPKSRRLSDTSTHRGEDLTNCSFVL
ncbi:hypothetical protein CLOSTMETH_03763 [[Clostridium] methylpentosum DSM 5476]|uniref:Uncharacterized protein n=1 Tax=[Clostridium] methylpentosum DSM 5476 TaxID=537013 RepID=C0EIR8_9FIRM|nr:hypothetical protein CLOSTMETH_03763 [[Clostridium] methylpentosum DSM 5476]